MIKKPANLKFLNRIRRPRKRSPIEERPARRIPVGSITEAAAYLTGRNDMTAMTPNAKAHEGLGALASRYVDVASLPWMPTRFKGVEIKVLMEDRRRGC
jgi:hypothetical protein